MRQSAIIFYARLAGESDTLVCFYQPLLPGTPSADGGDYFHDGGCG